MRAHGMSFSQRGVTIIEMLVALVVLSIGMLGVASLFTVTLRTSGNAIQRTQAVDLASNMADRIRANRRAKSAYAGTAALSDYKCNGDTGSTCNATEMAKNDIYAWQQEISRSFPGGAASGSIVYTAPATSLDPATYLITVSWKEQGRNKNETELAQSFALSIQVPVN